MSFLGLTLFNGYINLQDLALCQFSFMPLPCHTGQLAIHWTWMKCYCLRTFELAAPFPLQSLPQGLHASPSQFLLVFAQKPPSKGCGGSASKPLYENCNLPILPTPPNPLPCYIILFIYIFIWLYTLLKDQASNILFTAISPSQEQCLAQRRYSIEWLWSKSGPEQSVFTPRNLHSPVHK